MEVDHDRYLTSVILLVVHPLQDPAAVLLIDLVSAKVLTFHLVVLAGNLLPPPIGADDPALENGGDMMDPPSPDKGLGTAIRAFDGDGLEVEPGHWGCLAHRNRRSVKMFAGSRWARRRKEVSP